MSTEQKDIINTDKNIVINSVVGSGKTTTVLLLAKQNSNNQILLLTYNKRLRLETKQRAEELKLNNIEVHSFHSFCYKYYSPKCINDDGLLEIIKTKKNPSLPSTRWATVVIDEAQDITPLYYEIIIKFYNDMGLNSRLIIIGDIKQCIYGYNGSDSRYITLAPQLFNLNGYEWVYKKLTETFRIPIPIVNFINSIHPEPVIKSNKTIECEFRYVVCNYFNISSEVKHILKKCKYEDIFILAPSIKSENGPVRKLANKLSASGMPIFYPISDEEKLDTDIISGKIVFCTFHQSKGLERKGTIVFNFDNSYFQYYHDYSESLPNEMYVAITRSLNYLTVLHNCNYDFFDFVDKTKVDVIYKVPLKIKETSKNNCKPVSVTNLLRHLTSDTINSVMKFITKTQIETSFDKLKVNNKTSQVFRDDFLTENVADINGVAIVSYYEKLKNGFMTISEVKSKVEFNKLRYVDGLDSGEGSDNDCGGGGGGGGGSDNISLSMFRKKPIEQKPQEQIKKSPEPNKQEPTKQEPTKQESKTTKEIQELLYASNKFLAISNGTQFKMNQISDYSWLDNETLQKAVSRLDKFLKNDICNFEVFVQNVYKNKIINGYIDCIANKNKIYEFKCTDIVENVHFIQLAIYSYLLSHDSNESYEYYLFNIITGEMFSVNFTDTEEILKILTSKKTNILDDVQFLDNNKTITKKHLKCVPK